MTEEGKEIISAIQEMSAKIDNVQAEVSEIKQRVTKIETALENETNRNITILVDGHMQNADKLDRLQPLAEDVEYIKLKTDVIEAVTKMHSYDINYLKKVK